MISRDDHREAEHQIARLIYTYCQRLDAADFTGAAALFKNGVWHITTETTCRGSIEHETWLRENLVVHGDRLGTMHLVTNVVVDVADDGQTATSLSYVAVSQVTEDFPLQLVSQARYQDSFTLGTNGWEFTERRVHFDGGGDLHAHRRDLAPAR
ncbi:nuclear transport factor 2 family protein [Nesterenkonia sp. CL21]|uniref:nuclear transport factor 2 family protein n=1 Tax=Nesterenkonia sp. CL21 TaxID=3064894 RepID=UPI002879E7BB|nr:nuclear transport factor 2 family protein [Nesterenkonia sp. CL21]MDS2171854.1 nuclear transport factor 2 family protein [Nesterenkonia sp. CL21]